MFELGGASWIDTLGIPFGSESFIAIVFLVADESRNAVISRLMLRDYSGVKVDAGLPLIWCP